ncbi:hypothetical protein M2D63_022910 [Pseudomonas sp. BJa5]|uniref:hypothetical protein n=1 Tax=Pseudomonas sp. BJa5 TaxID=2936270 RepID=UPI00255972FA|nr:hypothetical protein [Pseudomonas sp. BGr12]MDL2423970.1 hypothetical protein [Pseudomonas sp. BGr12]
MMSEIEIGVPGMKGDALSVEALSNAERDLLALFRRLSAADQRYVLRIAEVLCRNAGVASGEMH